MRNTLYTNDVILVDKLTYGPKLPQSPFDIPWVNIAFYLNKNARVRMGEIWWDYKRLSGMSKINEGDLLVFDMKFGTEQMTIIKRCMAKPKSVIQIVDGDVFVNELKLNPSNHIKNHYRFKIRNREFSIPKKSNKDFQLIQDNFLNDTNWESDMLSEYDKIKLINKGTIDSVQLILDNVSIKSSAYPYSIYNDWNLDNYGPLKIPSKGMRIKLTQESHALYKDLIRKHEGVIVKEHEGEFYINNKKINSYLFKRNYYFVMGDNRKGSQDSRRWGLVPEESIIGKVQFVLFSNHQDEFRWDRLFKNLD